MPAAKREPSIQDVALLADVSRQTVSRVLNNAPNVSAHARTRVERAIAILQYRPNPAARALRTQRSGVIGVLVTTRSIFVAGDGLSVLEGELRSHGHRLLVVSMSTTSRDDARACLDQLSAANVDGLIVAATQRWAGELARDALPGRPVVVIQPGITADDGVSSVGVDLAAGVRQMVAHLVEQGYRDLEHVAAPLEYVTSRARVEAWTSELQRRGLSVRPVRMAGQLPEDGFRAAQEMLADGLPEAVFAYNDVVAVGVIRALHDAGIHVPVDVAVAGVDDMIGGAYLVPSLTTLRQPLEQMAHEAAVLLLEGLDGAAARTVLVAPELIVRESTRMRPRQVQAPPSAEVDRPAAQP